MDFVDVVLELDVLYILNLIMSPKLQWDMFNIDHISMFIIYVGMHDCISSFFIFWYNQNFYYSYIFLLLLLDTEYIRTKSEIGKKENRLFATRDIDFSHFIFPSFFWTRFHFNILFFMKYFQNTTIVTLNLFTLF